MRAYSIVVPLCTVFGAGVHSVALDRGNLSSICSQLKSVFPSQITLPADAEFEELRTANWDPVTWKTPSCVVTPNCTAEVQKLVKVLGGSNTSFAIRSGGHSPSPGAANIDDGVLVDMSRINHITLDQGSHLVKLGPGNRWKDVLAVLGPKNVTVVAPRVLDVGVGGSILGGGLSYLSGKYGLACDNVVQFEVVLSNASVVIANATHHSDLFWALKGGGNNFGIVTSYVVRTHPLGKIWGGFRAYTPDQLPNVVSALAEYQATVDDPDSSLILNIPLNNLTTSGFILNMVYLQPVAEPPAFKQFLDIPYAVDMTKIQTYEELLGSTPLPDLPRWAFRATTFAANGTLYQEILNRASNASELAQLSHLTAGTSLFSMQPISQRVYQHGVAQGGNPLDIGNINQLWGAFSTGWWDSNDDVMAHTLSKALVEKVNDVARESGQHRDFLFMNDADWDQDVLKSYGNASLSKLEKVSQEYDPARILQRLSAGGFKLGS
ncbi:putative FAD-binding oxidoreductase [Phaeosphaeria sp. MPI-PUGE-AT-0046c]|nr:putative FAD-binding oxidoreductase [Phaeosphaeria sp. MPI-PUGE-AT-0046c]